MDPNKLALTCEPVFEIEAAAGADGKAPLPKFNMVAYTGAPIRQFWSKNSMVIDLAGLSFDQQLPIRVGHDSSAGVGHTDSIRVEGGQLYASGTVSRDTEAAREVVKSSRNGFPWQASIGASVDQSEFIPENQSVLVNGKEFKGPINVIRKATLGEISFVDRGADPRTSAAVAAGAPQQEKTTVTPEEIAAAEAKKKADAEVAAAAERARIQASQNNSGEEPNAIINAARDEHARRLKITKLIEASIKQPGADLDQLERLAAEAITNRWSVDQTELAVLRATRPSMNFNRANVESAASAPTLIAAVLLACGMNADNLAKDRDIGERAVEAAWKHRNLGIHGLLAKALAGEGVSAPHGGQALWAAVVNHQIRAGFSTVDLPGILGTVGNKLLLDSFTAVEVVYDSIAQQADFNNFLTYTNYRLDHTGTFAQVSSTGELKQGKLSETSYTNKLETSGQLLTLSRQQIINDDLNALKQLYGTLGRKARLAVEKALIILVMESSDSFYTTARGNRISNAPLAIDKLGAAEAAMLGMVDASGDPIYASPSILLVPQGLKYQGDQIYTSSTLASEPAASGTVKQLGVNNPFRGRFAVKSSPYMALAALDGYSPTTWYLLANPLMLPAFQVAYLNGQRSPTIESSDAAFNTLGMQMRCYFDFGVSRVDYRGVVKNTAA